MKKKCTRCGKTKNYDEFYRVSKSKNKTGRTSWCKECRLTAERARYANNPEVKEYTKKRVMEYRSDPDNLARYKEYNAEYNRTKKGKSIQAASHKKYKRKYPNRIKAKSAVNNAVQRGEMPPISSRKCEKCGAQAENYHHHSYKRESWLDVIPLCRDCHIKIHKETSQ